MILKYLILHFNLTFFKLKLTLTYSAYVLSSHVIFSFLRVLVRVSTAVKFEFIQDLMSRLADISLLT